MSLLFTNRTEEDIILKDTLKYISSKCSNEENDSKRILNEINLSNVLPIILDEGNIQKKNFTLKFYNTLTKCEENKADFNEYINKEILEKTLPEANEKTVILMCGRGKMIKKLLNPLLKEIGHGAENIFNF